MRGQGTFFPQYVVKSSARWEACVVLREFKILSANLEILPLMVTSAFLTITAE